MKEILVICLVAHFLLYIKQNYCNPSQFTEFSRANFAIEQEKITAITNKENNIQTSTG